MAFKLRSGNKSSFKSMGSSPATQVKDKVGPVAEKSEDSVSKEEAIKYVKDVLSKRATDRKVKKAYETLQTKKQSPTKQNNLALDLGLGPKRSNDRSVPSGSISAKTSKEARNDANAKKTLKRGKAKVDYMQHTTGVNKNPTGKKIEKRRTDYLKSLDESPAKQIELALLRKRKGLGPREIQGEDDQSYEAAVTRKEMGMTKEYPYYYEINGQRVSKDAYIKYKNKPGGDEPGKQTNDPDVYGKKANNHGRGKKTK